MNLQKYTQAVKKLSIGLLPLLIIFYGIPVHSSPQQASIPQKISVKFPRTTRRGSPRRTVGGGTRAAQCFNILEGKTPPTVLMPTNSFGKTVVANPTIYVYVPKTDATSAKFVLQDEKRNEIYQQEFQLPRQSGILRISIPETAALKTNHKYTWFFTIVCDSRYGGLNPFVRSSLQRTTLTPYLNWYLSLKNVTPLQKAKIYARLEIWHETLSTLADLRSQQPKEWEELLQSVDLEAISKKPFLN